LLTNRGERLFQPVLGSDLNNLLFELNWKDNLDLVKKFIENCADNCEPRVNVLDVVINGQGLESYTSSALEDEHTISLTVIFNVINNPEPINLDIVLKRVR